MNGPAPDPFGECAVCGAPPAVQRLWHPSRTMARALGLKPENVLPYATCRQHAGTRHRGDVYRALLRRHGVDPDHVRRAPRTADARPAPPT